VLAGRSWQLVARNVVAPANYRALARAAQVSRAPLTDARRYLLGRGDYPCTCRLRTPTGDVTAHVPTQHDMFTVGEIFFREDYRFPVPDGRCVVVDIGSNIGLSALYFLSRSEGVRTYLFEPNPANHPALRRNLAGLEDRYELDASAVAAFSGTATFGVEPTGRYGGIGVETGETIEVRCRSIRDVVESILEREPRIDVLKIDTEGQELETVRALPAELLSRIGTILLEWMEPVPGLLGEAFTHTFACDTVRLENRAWPPAEHAPGGPATAGMEVPPPVR
jgi:FkbM family methyltransferase